MSFLEELDGQRPGGEPTPRVGAESPLWSHFGLWMKKDEKGGLNIDQIIYFIVSDQIDTHTRIEMDELIIIDQ